MPNIKLNKEVIFMWRPETRGEKAARENPQVAKLVDPPPVQVHDQAANDQALRDGGAGCFVDCVNGIQYVLYVICCCGCSTSYEDFQEM